MTITLMKGPSLRSNGLATAEEKMNHSRNAMTCKRVATRSDQEALSHDASRRKREARLFLLVSRLVKVAFACKF